MVSSSPAVPGRVGAKNGGDAIEGCEERIQSFARAFKLGDGGADRWEGDGSEQGHILAPREGRRAQSRRP